MSLYPSRWPPQHPDHVQVYAASSPNARKVTIALEELELPYELHRLDLSAGDQHDPEYLIINPNGKIPAIIDPDGPHGEPLRVMESGAILHYLARKSGRLMPTHLRGESEVLQWVFWQMGGLGPMVGQFGHFHKVREGVDAYATERFTKESRRLLEVLEHRLEGREWLVGEYSIADISIGPWVAMAEWYGGHEPLDLDSLPRVAAWLKRFRERPAVQRGWAVRPPA